VKKRKVDTIAGTSLPRIIVLSCPVLITQLAPTFCAGKQYNDSQTSRILYDLNPSSILPSTLRKMATEANDATAPPKEMDVDVDAEMEDTQDTAAATTTTGAAGGTGGHNTQNNESSSATLDHDFTQSEAQPAAAGATATATTGTGTGTGLLHGNRKDVTLREFLSKMDDYAPIVCVPHANYHGRLRLDRRILY
jgi:hypothetical protein